METQNTTSIKKDSSQISNIFIISNHSTKKILQQLNLYNMFNIKVTSSPERSVLKINITEQKGRFNCHLHVQKIDSEIIRNNISRNSLKVLLKSIFKLEFVDNNQSTPFVYKEDVDLFYRSKIEAQQKIIKLTNDKYDPFGVLQKTFIHSKIFNDQKKINLETFLTTIKKLPILKSFENIQLIIHPKGSSVSTIHSYSDKYSVGHNNSSTFNNLVTVIRKSKNKSFNNKILPKGYQANTGSFVAQEIKLKKHHGIILLTYNDFLPPTVQEIKTIDGLTRLISSLLESILNSSAKVTKHEIMIKILQSVPFHFSIIDKYQKVLFENNNEKISLISKALSNYLVNYGAPSNTITHDIYHFERIKILGELLNTLRHELVNPLLGIKMLSDIMSQAIPQTDQGQMLIDLSSNAKRCQDIIENFSTLYQENNIVQKTDLIKLIHEIIKISKSETRNINVKVFSEQENLPALYINQTWLTQVIFNLIINAAQSIRKKLGEDFMGYKDSYLNITLSSDQNKKNVTIDVKDSGVGINKKITDKIFSPFFTTKERGTGLGLSICKNLIKKINGSLFVKSNTDGATFTIILPIARENENTCS
ncbi:MAG: HAMP domain-containing histidine kinase [Bdellovibrionales bacterium]|nr:HAMP domain-containing histidine kinase [Bdellovibrionales bacterium]